MGSRPRRLAASHALAGGAEGLDFPQKFGPLGAALFRLPALLTALAHQGVDLLLDLGLAAFQPVLAGG